MSNIEGRLRRCAQVPTKGCKGCMYRNKGGCAARNAKESLQKINDLKRELNAVQGTVRHLTIHKEDKNFIVEFIHHAKVCLSNPPYVAEWRASERDAKILISVLEHVINTANVVDERDRYTVRNPPWRRAPLHEGQILDDNIPFSDPIIHTTLDDVSAIATEEPVTAEGIQSSADAIARLIDRAPYVYGTAYPQPERPRPVEFRRFIPLDEVRMPTWDEIYTGNSVLDSLRSQCDAQDAPSETSAESGESQT